MPVAGEVRSTSFHDLPKPMRARIGKALPVRDIAVLRAVSRHTFDDDTLAYLGAGDREAQVALTIREPHLQQLVRRHRDGAEAEDAVSQASLEMLEHPATFADACKAAEAGGAEVRRTARPLLVDKALSIGYTNHRARAAAELMRTTVTPSERDAMMERFHPSLNPDNEFDAAAEPFYAAAFAAADSAEERALRFASIDTPPAQILSAYVHAVQTPQEHEQVVALYAEDVQRLDQAGIDVMMLSWYQDLTENLCKKNLGDSLLRQIANLDVREHTKRHVYHSLAKRPIPDDVRAMILGQNVIFDDTPEHLARFADSPEARLAIAQTVHSFLRSTRAILFEKADSFDECRQLFGALHQERLNEREGEAFMAHARTPDEVHWVVFRAVEHRGDLLRKRLQAAGAHERAALTVRFTARHDAEGSLEAGEILADFAESVDKRRRVMAKYPYDNKVAAKIAAKVQSFAEFRELFDDGPDKHSGGIRTIDISGAYRELEPHDWPRIWELTRTPEEKLWVTERTSSPEVVRSALRSAGSKSERARIFTGLRGNPKMLYTAAAEEARTKAEQLAVATYVDTGFGHRVPSMVDVHAAASNIGQRSPYPAVRRRALRSLQTGSADWEAVADRATTARERVYIRYSLAQTRMQKLRALGALFGSS